MEIKAIRTDTDYREALNQISVLIDLDPDRNSSEGECLEIIGILVQAYEAEHYPIDPPDPIEAIRFRMDQSGMAAKDLIPFIGPLNRVYEILAHTRPLTLPMIRRIHKGMGIPAAVLINQIEEEMTI